MTVTEVENARMKEAEAIADMMVGPFGDRPTEKPLNKGETLRDRCIVAAMLVDNRGMTNEQWADAALGLI